MTAPEQDGAAGPGVRAVAGRLRETAEAFYAVGQDYAVRQDLHPTDVQALGGDRPDELSTIHRFLAEMTAIAAETAGRSAAGTQGAGPGPGPRSSASVDG